MAYDNAFEQGKHMTPNDVCVEQRKTAVNDACETPMPDHVARFWKLIETEHVRILIDIRRDHDAGQPPHWDSSSFSNDVAKALVLDRIASQPLYSRRQLEERLAIARKALEEARDELVEHNMDYHHKTDREFIAKINALLASEGK